MRFKKRLEALCQGFILFHLLWWIGHLIMQTPALPSPVTVYGNLSKVLVNPFYLHLGASFIRVLLALLITLGIGLLIGIMMGTSKKINNVLNPLVYFTYPIPKTALLPVIMILFGLGDGSKITLIVLITVFPMIVAVRDGVQHLEASLYHPLKSLGATKWQMFTQITLPAIVPVILTTTRLSVGTAISILFFAENYGTKYGLGYYIQDCWMRIDYISMYGGILMLGGLGFVLFITLDLIEYLMCRWEQNAEMLE